MNTRVRSGFVLAFPVLMLLCAPRLRSQEVDEKSPVDKGAPEQKAVEKSHANDLGRPCEFTTCSTKFLYFSNVSQPSELQDVTNSLRTIAEISRIQIIPFARLVIVKGTPEQVTLAEKVADEIDRAKGRFGGAGYRVDFKVNESDDNKKLRSRAYSLLTEARDSARLSVGRQAPAPSHSDAAPENKESPDAVAGNNIECRILSENDRTVELHFDAVFSGSGAREPGKNKTTGPSAVPTQVRVKEHVTVELGKPTMIGVLDDPDSEHNFQIEVTVTRIKERP